jgi:Arc/MetJ-type ribon-helix-helix transcriptional regulator
MAGEKTAVNIPKNLYLKVKRRVEESSGEFKNVEEYVTFVLNELVREEEPERKYSQKDEEEIKKRLKGLGYL